MAGIVRVQQIAREGQQLAAVFRHPALVHRVVLVEPGLGLRRVERGLVGGHADLAATKFAGDMHHVMKLRACQHPPGEQQGLVGHHQSARTALGQGDRRRQMRVDPFPVHGELRQLLLHRLLIVEAGLAHVEERRADHHVGEFQDALGEGKRRITMQRRSDEGGGPGVAVEQDVLPGDQDVVENHQCIDFVEAVGQRIVFLRRAAGEARAADELEVGRIEVADEAHGIVRQCAVSPVRDRRLGEGLVGIGGRRLELRAAHDDARVGFLHDMQKHVRVLLLRRLGAIALGVGVGRNVKRIVAQDLVDMIADVLGELRVHFVEHILPVEQRPHLADGFVADARHHAAHFFEQSIGCPAFQPPVGLRIGQLVGDGVGFAAVRIAHEIARRGLMLHVIKARADIHERLEHGMGRDVLDPLAADIDLPAVADRIAVLCPRADHGPS